MRQQVTDGSRISSPRFRNTSRHSDRDGRFFAVPCDVQRSYTHEAGARGIADIDRSADVNEGESFRNRDRAFERECTLALRCRDICLPWIAERFVIFVLKKERDAARRIVEMDLYCHL